MGEELFDGSLNDTEVQALDRMASKRKVA